MYMCSLYVNGNKYEIVKKYQETKYVLLNTHVQNIFHWSFCMFVNFTLFNWCFIPHVILPIVVIHKCWKLMHLLKK